MLHAAPTAVLLLSLSRAFVHARECPLIENEYRNSGSQRSVLATNSRNRWRHAKREAPAHLHVLRGLCDARKGPHEPFFLCGLTGRDFCGPGTQPGCSYGLASGRTSALPHHGSINEPQRLWRRA